MSRNLDNNNPGALLFSNQPKAVLEPVTETTSNPTQAKFETMDDGITAVCTEVAKLMQSGKASVKDILQEWPLQSEMSQSAATILAANYCWVVPEYVFPVNIDTVASIAFALCRLESNVLPFTRDDVLPLAKAVLATT